MLIKNIDEQTIALAGLYQSCYVVSNIAWKGEYNEQDFLPLINSILQIDSTVVKDIYIDIDNINSGFIYLKKQIIGDIFTRSSETRRYIESLKILSNHLMSDQKTITLMQNLLKELEENTSDLTTDGKAEKLSEVYQKTLSKFEPRIIVNGENKYLTDPIQASRIRTALFAGVRATLLWEQLGGSKWKLFLFKSSFSKTIDSYINSTKS
jgi:high frequency lysogenization protein|tara:strand:- start:1621 stop:2247 length:627 start_codon:yes stop_codon:yes gene_type:complete